MMTSVRRRAPDRSTLALLLAATLTAFGILLLSARPTVACSCAMPGEMSTYATAENAVFTGTAGVRVDRGVPVEVDQWLWGQGAAAVVWLTASSFGDSASCGSTPPPPGSSWIWVAWLPGNNGDLETNLCLPAAQLGSPDGDAMLKEALAAFEATEPPQPSGQPIATSAPTPTNEPEAAATASDLSALLVGGGAILVGLLLFGGVAFVARRQERR
jgi:hypothetical protein